MLEYPGSTGARHKGAGGVSNDSDSTVDWVSLGGFESNDNEIQGVSLKEWDNIMNEQMPDHLKLNMLYDNKPSQQSSPN